MAPVAELLDSDRPCSIGVTGVYSPDITAVRLLAFQLPDCGRDDVVIETVLSAQPGALFLSFGGSQLDGAIALTLGGRAGSMSLSFTSGTAVGNVALAFNVFSSQTGVRALALASGAGVRLESLDIGGSEFVSVRVLPVPTYPGFPVEPLAQGSIYRARPDDAGAADPATGIPFSALTPQMVVTGVGRDVYTLSSWGGFLAGRGPIAVVATPSVSALVTLTTGPASGFGNAQTLGRFKAFGVGPLQ